MEEIQKLISIKSKKGQRIIQLIDHNFRYNEVSRDNQLYYEIINEKVKDDLDGAYVLLNTEPSNRNYRNIKNRLKEKLLNHLFFLDYSKNTETLYRQVYYECARETFQINVLMLEEELEMAYSKAKETLVKTREYELFNMSIICLEIIRQYYSESGNLKALEGTKAEIKRAGDQVTVLSEARNRYFSVIASLNRSLAAQRKRLATLPEDIEFLKDLLEESRLTEIEVLSGNLSLLYNQFSRNFNANIEIADYIERRFLNRPVNLIKVNLDPKRISFIKMYAYLSMKDFTNGYPYSEKVSDYFETGSREWIAFFEYAFLLSIKTAHYEEASEIWVMVRDEGGFKSIPGLDSERWAIYKTWLAFFTNHKPIQRGFDINEFLDLQPYYPEEKEGYNIAFLLNQLLFLIREGGTEAIQEKVTELEFYSSDSLNKKTNYRNSVFIRMLGIMIEQEFSYHYTKEKATFYRKKLDDNEIEADLYNYMEVVPYEDLWEIILNYLKERKEFVHYRFYKG